jgi:hypothetical protein
MAEYTDFGFMRPGGNETPNPLYETELKKFRQYVEHPSYKERLGREMFGNNPIDQKLVEDEYNRRLKALGETKYLSNSKYHAYGIEGMYDPIKGTVQASNPESFYHEMTHRLDPLAQSMEAKTDNTPEYVKLQNSIVKYPATIVNPYNEKYVKNFGTWSNAVKNKLIEDAKSGKISPRNQDYEKVLNWVADKAVSPRDVFQNRVRFPSEEFISPPGYQNELFNTPEAQKLMEAENNSKQVERLRYLSTPTEVKGRINSLRIQAMDKFKFDPSKPFNINDYPELKKDNQYKELKQLKMSDEDINELSKYIARIPSSNYLQQAPQRQAQYQALQRMA